MPPSKTWLVLRRLLIWVWALAAVLALVLAGFVVHTNRRLSEAEQRYLPGIEAHVAEPEPSSAQSLAYTERLLDHAGELVHSADALKKVFDSGDPEALAELEPYVQVFLEAAETPPAHESILLRNERSETWRALRLLERAAEEASHRRDEARQTRCAAALAAVARALYQHGTNYGLFTGSYAEAAALSAVQRLVQEPTTSDEALARSAQLLNTPPFRAVLAAGVLETLRLDEKLEEEDPSPPLLGPVRSAFAAIYEIRLLERSDELLWQLEAPLESLVDREYEWQPEGHLFDMFAHRQLSSTRSVMIRMRTMEAIRELARQALTARRDGRVEELTRPEVTEALERYWGSHDQTRCNHGQTRSLLTWSAPG